MKSCGTVVASCAIATYAPSIYADSSQTESYMETLDDVSGTPLTEEAILRSQQLIEKGYARINSRTPPYVLPNFPLLKQSDPAWGNDIMRTCNKTIANSGCCLTSFTMIHQYYGGTNNPGQVNKIMGNSACKFQYNVAANKFGYTISNYLYNDNGIPNNDAMAFCLASIDERMPILIGMSKGQRTHFVAGYGYHYGKVTITIRDPAKEDKIALSAYLDNGWRVTRLYSFSK